MFKLIHGKSSQHLVQPLKYELSHQGGGLDMEFMGDGFLLLLLLFFFFGVKERSMAEIRTF